MFYGKEWSEWMRKEFKRRTKQASVEVLAKIRKNISKSGGPGKHSKPGEFPRKISGQMSSGLSVVMGSSGLSFKVRSATAHGNYLENDTAGGVIITPKRARWLRWLDSTGQPVFAKRVRQGAIKGRSHVRRTMVEMRPRLKEIYSSRVSGTLRVG